MNWNKIKHAAWFIPLIVALTLALITGVVFAAVSWHSTPMTGSGNVTITVAPVVVTSIAVTPNPSTTMVLLSSDQDTEQFTAIATYSNGSNANLTSSVTWASSSTSVATIASGGLATAVAQGSTNITATLGAVASPAVSLNVLPDYTISPTALVFSGTTSVTNGQALDLTATATVTNNSDTAINIWDITSPVYPTGISGGDLTATGAISANSSGTVTFTLTGTAVNPGTYTINLSNLTFTLTPGS